MSIIPQVLWFAHQMEKQLEENSYKGGWGEMGLPWLLGRAHMEMGELGTALSGDRDPELIIAECADAANFLMMIADNARKGT